MRPTDVRLSPVHKSRLKITPGGFFTTGKRLHHSDRGREDIPYGKAAHRSEQIGPFGSETPLITLGRDGIKCIRDFGVGQLLHL